MGNSRSELDDRLTVYHMVEVDDEYGETDRKPQELRRIWAGITPTSGRVGTLPGGMQYAEVSHRVRVRTQALPDISTDMYFLVRGQRMNVKYWYPVYKRRGMLDIFCSLEQGDERVEDNGA